MNVAKSENPTLFLLEDSLDLTSKLSRIATRLGWTVIAARSLAQAEKLCAETTLYVDAMMLDLMVPETDECLTEVDRLLDERAQLGETLTKRGQRHDEIEALHRKEAELRINQIDQQIMENIIDDAGIRFLRTPHGMKIFCNRSIAVAIFTARREESFSDNTNETLRSAVSRALGREPEIWFEKPVPPRELEDWLETKRREWTEYNLC
jgi:hypothetical protein